MRVYNNVDRYDGWLAGTMDIIKSLAAWLNRNERNAIVNDNENENEIRITTINSIMLSDIVTVCNCKKNNSKLSWADWLQPTDKNGKYLLQN
jgi:hypothetical protein